MQRMVTVRALMAQLKAGDITVDEVAAVFRAGGWKLDPESKSLIASYMQSEEMPDDNDTFWIDAAYSQHEIDDEVYDYLFDAIAGAEAHVSTTGFRRVTTTKTGGRRLQPKFAGSLGRRRH